MANSEVAPVDEPPTPFSFSSSSSSSSTIPVEDGPQRKSLATMPPPPFPPGRSRLANSTHIPSHVNDLPDEVMLMIFSHFSPSSLMQTAAPVCKKWRELALDKSIWRRSTSWFHWGEPWRFRPSFIRKAYGDIPNLDLVIRHQKSLRLLWYDLILIGLSCRKVESLAITVNIVDKQPTQEYPAPCVNYHDLLKLAETTIEEVNAVEQANAATNSPSDNQTQTSDQSLNEVAGKSKRSKKDIPGDDNNDNNDDPGEGTSAQFFKDRSTSSSNNNQSAPSNSGSAFPSNSESAFPSSSESALPPDLARLNFQANLAGLPSPFFVDPALSTHARSSKSAAATQTTKSDLDLLNSSSASTSSSSTSSSPERTISSPSFSPPQSPMLLDSERPSSPAESPSSPDGSQDSEGEAPFKPCYTLSTPEQRALHSSPMSPRSPICPPPNWAKSPDRSPPASPDGSPRFSPQSPEGPPPPVGAALPGTSHRSLSTSPAGSPRFSPKSPEGPPPPVGAALPRTPHFSLSTSPGGSPPPRLGLASWFSARTPEGPPPVGAALPGTSHRSLSTSPAGSPRFSLKSPEGHPPTGLSSRPRSPVSPPRARKKPLYAIEFGEDGVPRFVDPITPDIDSSPPYSPRSPSCSPPPNALRFKDLEGLDEDDKRALLLSSLKASFQSHASSPSSSSHSTEAPLHNSLDPPPTSLFTSYPDSYPPVEDSCDFPSNRGWAKLPKLPTHAPTNRDYNPSLEQITNPSVGGVSSLKPPAESTRLNSPSDACASEAIDKEPERSGPQSVGIGEGKSDYRDHLRPHSVASFSSSSSSSSSIAAFRLRGNRPPTLPDSPSTMDADSPSTSDQVSPPRELPPPPPQPTAISDLSRLPSMAFQCFPKLRALHLNLCNSATIKILEGLIENGLAKNLTVLDVQCMSLDKLDLIPSFINLFHLQFSSRSVDENNAVWETPDHQTPLIANTQLLEPLKKCPSIKCLIIGNKISSEGLDKLFEEDNGCLRSLTRLEIWVQADFPAIKTLVSRMKKLESLDITLSILEDDATDLENPFLSLTETLTYFSLVLSDEESINRVGTMTSLLNYFSEIVKKHPKLVMNVSAFLDLGFVEYEDVFESIVSGPSNDVSGGTFPLRTEADWLRIQKMVNEFKELASIEIDYQSPSDSSAIAKPERTFQAKISDLLLNVDSTDYQTNTQNIVHLLSLFSEIRQLTMELYTPDMTLINKSNGGLTFRDLPFWSKLESLKINSNTPISSDLARFIFLNCPNLRHLELKAMPSEMRPYFLQMDILAYLPRLKKLHFAYLQLKTGDSHMLQMDHLRKDFSSTLLEPMDANPVDDLIIYLDLFLKRNKMQFHDAAGDTRNGDVIQGKASFLIQKVFGKMILSERRAIDSQYDENPPTSCSHGMKALLQSYEANEKGKKHHNCRLSRC